MHHDNLLCHAVRHVVCHALCRTVPFTVQTWFAKLRKLPSDKARAEANRVCD